MRLGAVDAHWVLAIGYKRADVLYLDLRRSKGTCLYSVCSSVGDLKCQGCVVRAVSPYAMIFAFATTRSLYSLTSGEDIYSHIDPKFTLFASSPGLLVYVKF